MRCRKLTPRRVDRLLPAVSTSTLLARRSTVADELDRFRIIIDLDDPKAVELIAVRILGLASTVLRAYGGREAIDVARRELPDLIVLDLMMPEVNGFDVVEALQRTSRHGLAFRSWSSRPSRSPPRTAPS